MPEPDKEMLRRVQEYRKLVLIYEALDSQIDALIMAHGGASEKMPEDVRARYKELARKRDDIQNEMRLLEQQLLDE
jgi:hypothetical protein